MDDPIKVVCRDPKDYSDRHIARIYSDKERWFTGESVEHSPSLAECYVHFLTGGAEAEFRATHVLKPEGVLQ